MPESVWDRRRFAMARYINEEKKRAVFPLTETETWAVFLSAAEEWEESLSTEDS